MKTKNIEKEHFRRTETDKHKLEETCDKRHGSYIHLFSMSFVICFMLFAGIGVVSATDYYVATWGNNSNSGNLAHPWQNLSYADDIIVAGDTLYLINGTWFGETFTFTNSGTATHPITITAYNGTPTLNGSGYAFTINGKSHIHISGLRILNYGCPIYIEESNHIHFSDCEATGQPYVGGGFNLGSQYIYIDNCTIHEGAFQIIALIGKTSDAREPINHIYITNNKLYNSYKHNIIDLNGYMSNISIIGNELYNSTYDAIYSHTPEYGIATFLNISNNIIHNVKRGITLELNDSYIANNTIYDTSSYCFSITMSDSVTFIENTQLPSSAYPTFVVAEGGTDYFIRNNISLYRTFNGKAVIRDALSREDSSYFGLYNRGDVDIEFTAGRVFKMDPYRIRAENYSITNPVWYPDKSNASIIVYDRISGNDILANIYTYPMSAVPAFDSATVTVNKFDASLPQGEILVDFTANTTDGNNVVFTVWDLKPNYYYLIKRDGVDFTTVQADIDGYIQFSNSEWSASARTFTIEESSEPTIGTISGTVTNSTSGTPIEGAMIEAGAWYDNTDENGEYTILTVPEGTYTVTTSANGYKASSVENVTVTAGETTTANFELNPVEDTTPPTTSYGITPTPGEAGWNNATPVVVTFFRSASNGSIVKYTNYSKISETGPWTTVNVTTATGPDAENVTDIAEDIFNVTVSDEGITTIWYYSVDNNSNVETIKNVTVKISTTTPPPASISDLQNTTGITWINWTWTNPPDEDFGHTIVYLSSIWQTNTSDAYYNATGLTANTSYEIGTHTVDTYGNVNTTWMNQTAKTEVATDTTPPASISDLQNTTGTTWINWTWTNPTDADFNYTMVYLNGVWQTNTSNSYYNATGLTADTSYEIGTHTVDTCGNVNTTWVNQTTKTVNNSIPRYDINEDGTVDILDTTIVGQHFGETTSPPYPRYDVNEDGTVDILDTTIVGQHFGEIMR